MMIDNHKKTVGTLLTPLDYSFINKPDAHSFLIPEASDLQKQHYFTESNHTINYTVSKHICPKSFLLYHFSKR